MRRTSTCSAMRALRALTTLVMSFSAACGTTATITERSGARHEGRIVRGNATHLAVATAEGGIALRRDEIEDIDHPGNVMAAVGVVLLVPSIVWLASHVLRCEEGRQKAFCMGWAGAATFAAIGFGMALAGGTVWHRSRQAATQISSPSLSVAPLVWDRGPRQTTPLGAALSLTY